MTMSTIKPKWSNLQNKIYYDKLSPEEFISISHKTGFEDNRDVALVYPYIVNAHSLVELGAGFGRVLDYLMNQAKFKGTLYAIEQSPNLANWLTARFPQITLYKADLAYFRPPIRFEAALWMWSGISDFLKEEQLSVLKHIVKNYLTKKGIFIIETISPDISPLNAVTHNKQYFYIQENDRVHCGYVPNMTEIRKYADNLNLTLINQLHYLTELKRERILYILQRL